MIPDAAHPLRPARLRFRFTKLGRIRFTSQRDVARMWERALRRSGMPVAWTGGFSPRPLLSFGLALPTGHESRAEYVDVRLDPGGTDSGPGDGPALLDGGERPEELARVMTQLLPDGLCVVAAAALAHDAPSLQQQVTSCSWEMEVRGVAVTELEERIGRLLDAPSIPVRRERKGRWVEDDLRPSVCRLVLVQGAGDVSGREPLPRGSGDSHRIDVELATRPRGVRPRELLEGLGAGLALVRACRTHQWIERDGARDEPLPIGSGPGGVGAPAPGGVS